MKQKLVFLGDVNSINIELIQKSHKLLKNKVNYLIIGNVRDLSEYLKKLSSNLDINEIYNPLNFKNFKLNSLNIFNVDDISTEKYQNLLNQIKIANQLANTLNMDLVTLPINKSIFKKKLSFNGMTEYLAKLNKKIPQCLCMEKNFQLYL